MKASYSLSPEKRVKINLFAHTGEAVIFWVSLAGVLLVLVLGILSHIRSRDNEAVWHDRAQLIERVEHLEEKLEAVQEELRGLREAGQFPETPSS